MGAPPGSRHGPFDVSPQNQAQGLGDEAGQHRPPVFVLRGRACTHPSDDCYWPPIRPVTLRCQVEKRDKSCWMGNPGKTNRRSRPRPPASPREPQGSPSPANPRMAHGMAHRHEPLE